MTTNENELATTGEEHADASEAAPVSTDVSETPPEGASETGAIAVESDATPEPIDETETPVDAVDESVLETEAVADAVVESVEETETAVEAVDESVLETEVVADAVVESVRRPRQRSKPPR